MKNTSFFSKLHTEWNMVECFSKDDFFFFDQETKVKLEDKKIESLQKIKNKIKRKEAIR